MQSISSFAEQQKMFFVISIILKATIVFPVPGRPRTNCFLTLCRLLVFSSCCLRVKRLKISQLRLSLNYDLNHSTTITSASRRVGMFLEVRMQFFGYKLVESGWASCQGTSFINTYLVICAIQLQDLGNHCDRMSHPPLTTPPDSWCTWMR